MRDFVYKTYRHGISKEKCCFRANLGISALAHEFKDPVHALAIKSQTKPNVNVMHNLNKYMNVGKIVS